MSFIIPVTVVPIVPAKINTIRKKAIILPLFFIFPLPPTCVSRNAYVHSKFYYVLHLHLSKLQSSPLNHLSGRHLMLGNSYIHLTQDEKYPAPLRIGASQDSPSIPFLLNISIHLHLLLPHIPCIEIHLICFLKHVLSKISMPKQSSDFPSYYLLHTLQPKLYTFLSCLTHYIHIYHCILNFIFCEGRSLVMSKQTFLQGTLILIF